jgi:hypothetical protein
MFNVSAIKLYFIIVFFSQRVKSFLKPLTSDPPPKLLSKSPKG